MNDSHQLTLRDVALKASERVGGLQGRALGRAADAKGLRLSYTTVDKIIAGTYTSRPTRPTLEALAALSGYSLEKVYEAAGEPMPLVPFAEQLPPDADLLSADQRRVVIDVMRQFAKQNRELAEARQEKEVGDRERSAPKTPAGESPAAEGATVHEFPGSGRLNEPMSEEEATVPDKAVAHEGGHFDEEAEAFEREP